MTVYSTESPITTSDGSLPMERSDSYPCRFGHDASKGVAHVSVAKVIEITSTSPGSFEDAIRKGISKAQQSIEGIRGAWISEQKVEVAEDGTIRHFRVDMKLTFVLDK